MIDHGDQHRGIAQRLGLAEARMAGIEAMIAIVVAGMRIRLRSKARAKIG